MKILASLVIVGAMVVLGLKLAGAPLNRVYSAEECEAAYAKARTRADTTAVDFHPYSTGTRARNPRCGEVRAVHVDSAAVLRVGQQLGK